VGSVSF